ncbi:hypothetical protein XENOCAPTIV_012655, partial [Xenoophorus captivus]
FSTHKMSQGQPQQNCCGRETLDQLYTELGAIQLFLQMSVSLKQLGLRSAPPSPRPWFSERVACPLQVGGEFLPQVEEFKYLRFTSAGERSVSPTDDRCGCCCNRDVVLVPCGEES